MYVRDNVVSAKCFSGKCNFWKVFFGEVYRIRWADCEEKFIAMVVFCVLDVTFYSLIYVQDNYKLICSNKAATGKSFEVANSDN